MCKSRCLILLNLFLSASIAFSGGGPDLSTVKIDIPTIVPYSLVGQGGNTINEVFFLGTYTTGTDRNQHLFCREVDASTGAALDVDLGAVDTATLLPGKPLYVWSTDPQENTVHIYAHYPPPMRYLTSNAKPGTPVTSNNKRVEVTGVGKGANGVHITDQD
jgi:hypothetical protein